MSVRERGAEVLFACFACIAWMLIAGSPSIAADPPSRFATSDSLSGYVHWIDLYDANNRRIDPTAESPAPYSPAATCGRCHDVDVMTHGWHFNAVDESVEHGRPGQPWVWGDPRTGTYLPLSYRGEDGTYHPDAVGMSRWEVAAKFGGYLPGAGPGAEESLASGHPDPDGETTDRSAITGPLPLDCMLCHRRGGSGYSPFVWTEQIEQQNFAYAPSVAMGIATVSGSMQRLRDDFDPEAEDAAERLPKLSYEQSQFRQDGKLYFDVVRKPENDACYYCHTNLPAQAVRGDRWQHDEDVHLRAGMDCADCHRNGLEHHTVRGFEGERHPSGGSVASLSCRGCHLGESAGEGNTAAVPAEESMTDPGRLGAPLPRHRGLPPIHLERLTCTACHSGPVPALEARRELNSVVHQLGSHQRRTGDELPGIVGPVILADSSSPAAPYQPHRLLWPSFWGTLDNSQLTPLHPEQAYPTLRRALRVRPNFSEELGTVSVSSRQRSELLGEDRARVSPEEWSGEEQAIIAEAESELRREQVTDKLTQALEAVADEVSRGRPVFISGGVGFGLNEEGELESLSGEELGDAAEPYAWPLAHNVRPARHSLGADGCAECHREDAPLFASKVTAVGVLPDQSVEALTAQQMVGGAPDAWRYWNQLFQGRELFKLLANIAFGMALVVTLSAIGWNLGARLRRV